MEESFTNFEKGINWRSYVVCDVAYNNVNNWLWTPFIERGEANRIYIEIKFSMRDCSLFPGTALSCKETFSLLYYEFDAATREPPPWEPESYKLIDRIAADEGRFTSSNEVCHFYSFFYSLSCTMRRTQRLEFERINVPLFHFLFGRIEFTNTNISSSVFTSAEDHYVFGGGFGRVFLAHAAK